MRQLMLALSLATLAIATPAAAQSVAGEWNAQMNTPGGTREYKVLLQVKGDSLSGTVKRPAGDAPLQGTVKGNMVTFSYTIDYGGNALVLTVTATLDGDTMKGSIDFGGAAQEAWSATRATTAKPESVTGARG
jgi:hypothetical protein